MSRVARDVTVLLRARGVIPADAPEPASPAHDRPWFIALLQGIAGWFAGLFLLVFLGMLFGLNERASLLFLGALLLVGAWLIYRRDRDAVFLDQFALALSIAGQFAVAWGVIGDNFEGLALAASLLVLQVLIWLVMPNRTARTLAALFATIAWVYTIRFLLRPGDSFEQVMGLRNDAGAGMSGAWALPVAWLLTWAPPLSAVWWLVTREPQWMARGVAPHARPALTGLLLGISLAGVVAEPFGFLLLGNQGTGMNLNWQALFPLLSIGLAAFAGYGAFRVRSTGLLGFAILAALLHLSRFYYFYGTTLLWKSLIMLGTGTVLLLLGVWMQRREHRGVAG